MRRAHVLSVVLGLVLLAFLGCSSESAAPGVSGGGGGGGGGVIANPTGQFVDAPVQGITVVSNNGAQQSVTGRAGGFLHTPGLTTFKLGNLLLGTVNNLDNDVFVTPLVVANTNDINNNTATNIMRFLQMLDSDPSPVRMDLTRAAQALVNVQPNALDFSGDPALFQGVLNASPVLQALQNATPPFSPMLGDPAAARDIFLQGEECSRSRFGWNNDALAAYIRDPSRDVVTIVNANLSTDVATVRNRADGGTNNPYAVSYSSGHGGDGYDGVSSSKLPDPRFPGGPQLTFTKVTLPAPLGASRVFRGVFYHPEYTVDGDILLAEINLQSFVLGPLVIWINSNNTAGVMVDPTFAERLQGTVRPFPTPSSDLDVREDGTFDPVTGTVSFPFIQPLTINSNGRINQLTDTDLRYDDDPFIQISACEVPS